MSLRLSAVFLSLATVLAVTADSALGDPVELRIRTDKVVNTINPFVYGHFFEHIYNGGDNGIWGEMVWNRSFEYLSNYSGDWKVTNGVLSQSAFVDGARSIFGDPSWRDYEFTVEARKVSGAEGFLILVRATEQATLWANLGGWGNEGHQLENIGAPQNAQIGSRVPGRIEPDRWYRIRVRVDGNRVQTWLDDQLVLNDMVPEQFNRAGAVGVGTWQTAAEFRNAKVTSLDGRVLFEGAPPVPKPREGAGFHWQHTGQVFITGDNPLNDQYALEIVATDQEAGVSQRNFALRAGETYRGSLWLKGTSPGGGRIRFTSGNDTVQELPIPAPGAQWREFPIQFTAARDALDATLHITFPAGARVTLDQVSLMADASARNDGFRPDVYKAFADLKPTIIRWPGGCYAEQYHWKHGIGPQHTRKKNITPMWDDYDPNALGSDEFMKLCRKLNAEPIIVINTGMHVTGTSTPEQWAPWIQEACEWVEYLNGPVTSPMGRLRSRNGHPEPYKVKYFEIDNELWRSKQTSPAVYARAVPLFAEAMKKVDPSIVIVGHGGNGTDRNYNRTLVNNAATSFDILSIHHYTGANGHESGVIAQDSLYADTISMIKASRNPDMKIYVSEWNLQTTDWRTGLYAGGLLNVFEKHGEYLHIGGPALLFRHTSARDWDNAFINFDHKGYFVAPNYVVMKLWHDNFAPERLEIDAPGIGRLNVIATRTADKSRFVLKAVNPTNSSAEITATFEGADAFAGGTASFQLVAPGSLQARNTMQNPENVKPAPAPVTLEGRTVKFAMPALSAGVVTISRSAANP